MATEQVDPASPIRVSVALSQSSYFAGETLTATITITNLRTANALIRRPHLQAHKRASHSVSSAPLARPPTSPITPRTAAPPMMFSRSSESGRVERKGLVGVHLNAAAKADADKLKRKPLVKSHSLVITTDDLGVALSSSPRTGTTFTPQPRSASLPLPPNHPHARKQSVADFRQPSPNLRPSPSSILPNHMSASSSTFSLSLDPISEGSASAFPATPAHDSAPTPGPSIETNRASRHSDIGLGRPMSAAPHPAPRTATSGSFNQKNTELLLYAYAQFVGSVTIVPPSDSSRTSLHDQTLRELRTSLVGRKAIGGGSMDITSSLHSRMRTRTHSRTSSRTSNILSLLSPSPSMPALQWSPGHMSRSPSLISSFLPTSFSSPSLSSSNSSVVGLGIGGIGDDYDDYELPLPTFELQPTMLAVDLALAPGESRSYTYSVPMPENLPPTFKGRILKFSYQLVIGTCRAASAPTQGSSSGSGPSTSRVMKIPIRIYNSVDVSGRHHPYDLLWPAAKKRSPPPTAKVVENIKRLAAQPQAEQPKALNGIADSKNDLQAYAKRLLSSFDDSSGSDMRTASSETAISPIESHMEKAGCREAIEVLTRNLKRVSYDVTKEDVKVAVVTFVKSAYRLGETVQGVLEFNERPNRARILKVSITLEAHESLPPCLAPQSLGRPTCKVHAEHHYSLATSCLRTPFALDIPSDASPAFLCDVSNHSSGAGGLEWKIHLRLLVSIASPNAQEGSGSLRAKQLVQDGPTGEWGTSWTATKNLAPLERIRHRDPSSDTLSVNSPLSPSVSTGWASYLFTSLVGPIERPYHDGDEENTLDDDLVPGWVNASGGRRFNLDGTPASSESAFPARMKGGEGPRGEWTDMKVEMVECEIPIKVWPGNTEFRPQDVVFDL